MRVPFKTLWKTSNAFKEMVIFFFLHIVVFFFLFIVGLILLVKGQWVGLFIVTLAGRESYWIGELAQEIDRVRGYRRTF